MLFSKNPDDVKRFMNMTADRRKLIDETPATPLPKEYGVNRLAKDLHPLYVKGKLIAVQPVGNNCKTLTFQSLSENKRFPYFRAGQYVTLSKTIGGSFITRPYSISSSPKDAMRGILQVTVQRSGIFSTYLTEQAQVGDAFLIGEPCGDFCYDDIRDCKNIVAVAGGSGVTPFLSMIKSLNEGSDDFNLLLLYGAKTRKDLLIDYKDVANPKVKLVIVLSDERADGYEHGFITADLLNKYLPQTYSMFMCGPDGMYAFLDGKISKLTNAPRSVRREYNCVGDRETAKPQMFNITVHIRDSVTTIKASANETIMTALERANLKVPSRCRSGFCGYCHTRLISGQYFVDECNEHRRLADLKFGYIHPCCSYPLSDMELDIPPIPFEEVDV